MGIALGVRWGVSALPSITSKCALPSMCGTSMKGGCASLGNGSHCNPPILQLKHLKLQSNCRPVLLKNVQVNKNWTLATAREHLMIMGLEHGEGANFHVGRRKVNAFFSFNYALFMFFELSWF